MGRRIASQPGKPKSSGCIHAVGLASTLLISSVSCIAAHAQCAQNNYVQDGAPSAQRDCQPLAAVKQISPDAMSAPDQQLVSDRHAELVHAAGFYGFDLEAPGWTYQQGLSPLLHKHVLLVFTNATPLSKASHFTAIVPASGEEKIQVVPAFTRGLRPYLPGWESKGTYSVFNRLVNSELSGAPISTESDWIQYAVLYLALIGRDPAVPTETDSVKANWDLSVKRGTTPIIMVAKNGAATISCSDVADPARTAIWKLSFNPHGQILKAERAEALPAKVHTMQTVNGIDAKVRPVPLQQ